MGYVLGVDGGNTKTIALVAQTDGAILGAGRAGRSDIYATPTPEAAVDAIEQAVTAALQDAALAREAISVGCFSLAGADWPEDFAYLRRALTERGLCRRVEVVNDALGALRAGSPEGTGVVIAAGTGIAIGARAPDGRTWHSSFWPVVLGAQALGQQTLHAVLRAELGIDPPTSLTERVTGYFGRDRVEDVLHLLTAREPHPGTPDLAGLARALLDEAERGDAVARKIVREQGRLMGDYAAAAARQVGIANQPFPLVLAGGVLRHPSKLLAGAVIERTQQFAPALRPVRSRFEPAVGALFLALEMTGAAIDEAILARLEPTLPPSALFAT